MKDGSCLTDRKSTHMEAHGSTLILTVDDEPTNHLVIEEIVTSHGYQVKAPSPAGGHKPQKFTMLKSLPHAATQVGVQQLYAPASQGLLSQTSLAHSLHCQTMVALTASRICACCINMQVLNEYRDSKAAAFFNCSVF